MPVDASVGIGWRDTYAFGLSFTHLLGGATFLKMGPGDTFLNAGVSYQSSPVSDGNRILLLPVDESVTVSLGIAHTASEKLTYSLGGAVVFGGDARLDETTQGIRYRGKLKDNVAFVMGGSLQLRW